MRTSLLVEEGGLAPTFQLNLPSGSPHGGRRDVTTRRPDRSPAGDRSETSEIVGFLSVLRMASDHSAYSTSTFESLVKSHHSRPIAPITKTSLSTRPMFVPWAYRYLFLFANQLNGAVEAFGTDAVTLGPWLRCQYGRKRWRPRHVGRPLTESLITSRRTSIYERRQQYDVTTRRRTDRRRPVIHFWVRDTPQTAGGSRSDAAGSLG